MANAFADLVGQDQGKEGRNAFTDLVPTQQPQELPQGTQQGVDFSGDLPSQQISPNFIIDNERKNLLAEEGVKRGLLQKIVSAGKTSYKLASLSPSEVVGGSLSGETIPEIVEQKQGIIPDAGTTEEQPEMDFIKPMTWKNVIGQAVSNTPKSFTQFVKDVISPFLSPEDTIKAMGGLAQGVGQKFIPGRQDQEDIADDLMEMFKDRYGGIENLKKTLAKDPVGLVADISSLLIPAGAAVKGVGAVSKVKTISKVGKALSKAGEIVEPISAVGKVAKKTASAIIPKELPGALYQSAAKFSTSLPVSVRKKLTKTALDESLMPTVHGLDELREKVNVINDDITKKIDLATSTGKKIPIEDTLKGLNELRKEALLSTEPVKELRTINNITKQIRTVNKNIGKKDYTPTEVQRIKQKIYEETDSYYSKVANTPIRVDTKHAIAKAAKESLEDIFPEIKQLNKNEGSLIALRKELEKSAARISNRDFSGLGTPIKITAGGAAGGPLGAAVGAAVGLFDMPKVKAKLAIVANRLKKKGVVLPDDSLLKKYLEIAPGGVTATSRQAGKLTENIEEGNKNE